jgi:integrase
MTDSPWKIPKAIYPRGGRYYKVVRGKWIALTPVVDGLRALREALLDLPLEQTPTTIGELLPRYLSEAEITETTRREYRRIASSRLMHHFGRVPITTLTTVHVAKYLQKRKDDGHGPMGNREQAVLSGAYEFAMRHGWAASNPCRGVRRNKERPRERYVTDAEFLAAFEAAPEHVQDFLAIGLLTGARQGDLRGLKRTDLTPDGINIVEGKTKLTTGKVRLVQWSDALRFFVRRALERQATVAARGADIKRHRRARPASDYVLVNQFNQPWTLSGIQSAMRRLPKGWHFHDLRGKSASDAGHNILGHGQQMLAVYVRHQTVAALR